MAAKRQNKAVIRNAIENALFSLMKQKGFDDFSICELCDTAGVGRSSFYRYYDSKEEVLAVYLLRIWRAWCEANGVRDKSGFSLENASSFICHVYENKELFDMIYQNNLDRVITMLIDRNIKSGKFVKDYGVSFFVYGVFGMLKDWWARGYTDPPEELIGVIENIFTHAGE